MEKITKYKAFDGSIFDTEKECLNYEKILAKVDEIMKPFGKRPDDCSFTNGGGFIQHDISDVSRAKTQLTDLGNEILGIKPYVNFNWLGRYLDGCGSKCLYSAWTRLSNIDYKNREWGQGYYAVNPEKGKQIPYKVK